VDLDVPTDATGATGATPRRPPFARGVLSWAVPACILLYVAFRNDPASPWTWVFVLGVAGGAVCFASLGQLGFRVNRRFGPAPPPALLTPQQRRRRVLAAALGALAFVGALGVSIALRR
jgi:hypothetical protein